MDFGQILWSHVCVSATYYFSHGLLHDMVRDCRLPYLHFSLSDVLYSLFQCITKAERRYTNQGVERLVRFSLLSSSPSRVNAAKPRWDHLLGQTIGREMDTLSPGADMSPPPGFGGVAFNKEGWCITLSEYVFLKWQVAVPSFPLLVC